AEMAENVGKFIEKAFKELRTHGEVADISGELAYRPIKQEFDLGWASAAVFMALCVYIHLKKQRAEKQVTGVR
ncbi:MAG TPA: hypothetical protein VME23_09980, partial [Terracidiphilus sp.]|nr:hypothetical protein [Terracidiphilus sp.]